MMASLNHERIVKLLGVIMEDRGCSLVMELIPRGNLLVMLQTVSVPISIKGRIILEILEGMVYLTEKCILHKDIKPENILVDRDFHIKIADLGLAAYKTWSKLTKEESRRKSRMRASSGGRGAGTLSYMAPEHLESVNTPSTEKSDVYSFAIVVWVILTGEEPYANARSEDQISHCVRQGDRPMPIPTDAPEDIIDLMKRCWAQHPQQRPKFRESHTLFLSFYTEKLEPNVESDLINLQELYEGPSELVQKMSSLSMTHESVSVDGPAPLVSSNSSSVPIEASIDDLHDFQEPPRGLHGVQEPPRGLHGVQELPRGLRGVQEPPRGLHGAQELPRGLHGVQELSKGLHAAQEQRPVDTTSNSIQSDALSPEPSPLDEKLLRELYYHKYGSYNCKYQTNLAHGFQHSSSNPHSSVQSWNDMEPVQVTSEAECPYRPTAGLYESMNTSFPFQSPLPGSASSPSLSQFNQQHPHSHLDRQQSYPAYPVTDTSAPEFTPGRLFSSMNSISQQDPGCLYIQNASGIQIGSNNTMKIKSFDGAQNIKHHRSDKTQIKERIQKYEDCPVTGLHLDLLKDNIGQDWKQYARALGLTTVEIDTIEYNNCKDGLSEIIFQMLELWKMKEGSVGCTIGKLCTPLVTIVKESVLRKILDTCESSFPIG
ncbi:receptor-interacting serine/threonine-protein kinase 1 isoform X2 [Betta splendens]|nr:receptor-interacting serine/threonine-protein kinase 1 isoform X2 [Betta splendens]XP_055359984.1 receptor-interacting serine/threonine-protein kinase 1 isoform X2 [Betta splendens]